MTTLPASLSALVLTLSLCAAPAFAAFDGPSSAGNGGFAGPAGATLTKASQVAGAADDTPCLLEGSITERVAAHKDRYVFKDDSGTVLVKIGNKQFRHRTVTPENRVRLSGEVDTKRDRPAQVDVDWMEILK